MGTLALTASNNGGSSWTTLWSISGDQGNGWINDQSVDLSAFAGSTVKLRFDATLGNGFASDMAIDDVQITVTSIVPDAENEENKSPEDLSGGGQEATKEQMEQKRLEETVNTDIRKGKELDEVPEDFESGKQNTSQKVLMRKVDDDPALFLKRKFQYQVKKENIKPLKNADKW